MKKRILAGVLCLVWLWSGVRPASVYAAQTLHNVALPASFRTTVNLNLRVQPNTDSPVVRTVPYDAVVTVTGLRPNGWVAVIATGPYGLQHGYMYAYFLEPLALLDRIPGGEGPAAAPAAWSLYRAVVHTNVRFFPASYAAIIGVAPQNSLLRVDYMRADGWAEVTFNDALAYVDRRFLTPFMHGFSVLGPTPNPTTPPPPNPTTQPPPNPTTQPPVQPTPTSAPTLPPVPTPVPTVAPPAGVTFPAQFRTTANLNMRAQPNTASEVLFLAPIGTLVTVTAAHSGGWFSVVHNHRVGFMHSDFLTRVLPPGTGEAGVVPGALQWPVPGRHTISSPFGGRINPVTHRWETHTGIDIPAPTGTPIVAAQAGTVTFSGWMGGFGNTIILDHGNGYTTLYAHNNRNLVTVGTRVTCGQHIADVGATGQVTGPHLHFEVRIDGRAVNPNRYLGI